MSFRPGEVVVWKASLATWPRAEPFARQILTPSEWEQANRFRIDEARLRYVIGRVLLRETLSRLVDAEPAELALEFTGHGKPQLKENRQNIQFNLSHSGEVVMLGVAREMEIGVDVEQIRPLSRRDQIAQGILSPEEWSLYSELSEHQRQQAFFTIWTRKEAIVKAVGRGLLFPLTELEVSFQQGEARLLRFGEAVGDDVPWHLSEITCPAGYLAALATKSPIESLEVHDWQPTEPS